MSGPVPALRGSRRRLCDDYDVGLLDLDGVVYVGDRGVAHAASSLATARSQGMRVAFVTNNALRTPDEVAGRLRDLGVPADGGDVVTSAQAAARSLADRLPAGSRVLVAGGEGLRAALRERGLEPVATADDGPVAVVCGHDPTQTWARLAEATLALRAGLPWVASNTDATIPDPRGRLPGAGAVVALLSVAAGRSPDAVAGKPHPALHHESVVRTAAAHPLVVGDRLDTDIEGARNAGVDCLLVLTGVTDLDEVLHAPPVRRPSYVSSDLRGLLSVHPEPRVTRRGGAATAATAGGASAELSDGVLTVRLGDGSRDDGIRAACALAWSAADSSTGPADSSAGPAGSGRAGDPGEHPPRETVPAYRRLVGL